MPKKSKEPIVRFRMETGAFVTVWRNHISHPKADDWKTFVSNCFERFSEVESNKDSLTESDPKWTKWTKEQSYSFLSERCYSKCMTIKGKLKREKQMDVDLPEGYLNRTGERRSKRVSIDDIAAIFNG